MTRDEISLNAVNTFKENNELILQLATGVGKSKISIDCLKSLNYSPKVLLIVAEISHKDNWMKEFIKWTYPLLNIRMECYASLTKVIEEDNNWEVVIFDECHHVFSEKRFEIFKNLVYNKLLFLSATIPKENLDQLKDKFKSIQNIKVTLKQAIESAILPIPEINLIPLTLNDSINDQEILVEKGKKDLRISLKCSYKNRWIYMNDKVKYPNISLTISCTQQEKYNYISDQMEYYQKMFFRTKVEFHITKYKLLGAERKRFMGECKTEYVKTLLQELEDMRYICFCSSINQAEILGENTLHSKIKMKDNLKQIESFNNKEIDNLFCIGMLQEGQNLVDIEAGIIVQLDGKERGFVQKMGRALRGKSPILFVFYYKDTQDEKYLNVALENIDMEHVNENYKL